MAIRTAPHSLLLELAHALFIVGDASGAIGTAPNLADCVSESAALLLVEITRPLPGVKACHEEDLGAQVVSDACNERLVEQSLPGARRSGPSFARKRCLPSFDRGITSISEAL
jgi:hypothetical protein